MDEDSVKKTGGGGGLGSSVGEEGCDFASGFGDFGKMGVLRAGLQGEEASLEEFLAAEVESEGTGDPSLWMRAGVEAEARGSECNSSVCRGVGDQDGAGDVARGCMILELGDESP